MQRARKFAVQHVKRFVFRPSVALASYDTIYLFFLISKPMALLSIDKERVDRIQHHLAVLLHGGYPRKVGSWVPLPLRRIVDAKPRVSSRLLWAEPQLVYDLDRLDDLTTPSHVSDQLKARRRTPSPPDVRLRTLMDEYELADLDDLPTPLRQLIAAGHRPSMQLSLHDDIPLLVAAMAQAGFGFEDVRLVLSDQRFPLSLTAHIDSGRRRGLALRYINALRSRGSAYPPRLPYGITGIVALKDVTRQTTDRYLVRGGTESRPFDMEISHDVLISARRFHRALASHLRSFPYRVPQEVWEEVVLRRGLRDPRIIVARQDSGPPDVVSLVERVEAFASEAKPLEPWLWESGDPVPWPVLRDGQVVFRLAVLQERLATGIRGSPPRRGEVAAAVRAAGGAPYGAMRFGGRVIRVWTLPYVGRTSGPARRHERPRA